MALALVVTAGLQGLHVQLHQLGLLGGHQLLDRHLGAVEAQFRVVLENVAIMTMLARVGTAASLAILVAGMYENLHVGALHLGRDQGGIHIDLAAGNHGV